MGLSIHYNGKIKKDASLSEMIEEVKDVAELYILTEIRIANNLV